MRYRTYARLVRSVVFAVAIWIVLFSLAWFAFGLRHVAAARFGDVGATLFQALVTLGPLALEAPLLAILLCWTRKGWERERRR